MRQLKISKSITNRKIASLDRYLQEISKEDMITQDEEISLAKEIKAGNKKALIRLVNANLRFVVSVSKQYQNQGMSLPDLINEGNLGLIKAAKKFDETRGFKFISYAVWWIRQSILQAIAEQGRTVRLPLNQVGFLTRINREQTRFLQENERNPTINELSDSLEMSRDKIYDSIMASNPQVSFDAPLASDDANNLLDVVINHDSPKADRSLENESLVQEIERVLGSLTHREQRILKLFYGINYREMSLEEIGDELGLTRERVRQIKEKAIRRLRYSSRCNLLKNYL